MNRPIHYCLEIFPVWVFAGIFFFLQTRGLFPGLVFIHFILPLTEFFKTFRYSSSPFQNSDQSQMKDMIILHSLVDIYLQEKLFLLIPVHFIKN